MASRFERYRRWMQVVRKLTPVLLDTAGIIMLSGSTMLWWGLAAGVASLGFGCFVLNWRIHGS